MKLRETIRKVLREEHEDMHKKFNVFMLRRDYQIKDSIKKAMKIILPAVNANGIDKSKDFVVEAICNSAVILLFNENNLDLGGEEYYESAKIYIKNNYTDYIIEQLKLGEEKNKGINESISPWILRRFDIDELDDLVKDVKDQIEEGQTMIDAIYDTVRQFIATKQFNDIDNAGTEQEYWDSYLVYEKPLIKFVKEKLESGKEEMREQIDRVKNWIQFLNENISNTEFIIDDNQFKLLVDNELVSSCYFTILDNYVGLHGMITYEKFLRMGYGKILMKNIFNHVKNKLHMNLIKLSVMNDNHRAIDFYKTLGFISEKDNKNKMNHTMYKELGSEKEEMREEELTERCWAGYTQKGMKTMFGKRYPNCVKKKK